MLTWSKDGFLVACTVATFTITDTKLYVHFLTFSTQDKVKLLKQLESGFKRTVNWHKYQYKATQQTRNRNLDF